VKSKRSILIVITVACLLILIILGGIYAKAYATHDHKAKAEEDSYYASFEECNARSQQNEEDANNGVPLSFPKNTFACYNVPVSIGRGHWGFPVFIENGDPQQN
jgi:hypothetical protein